MKRIGTVTIASVLLTSLGLLIAFAAFAEDSGAGQEKTVSVFPAPKTPVASDTTTFSFRGLKPRDLGKVRIVGAKSGRMSHTRLRHSDGRGVSLVPGGTFTRGEKVEVFTGKQIKLTRNGDFWVRIARFYGNDRRRVGPQVPLAPGGLNSRPEFKPPVFDVLESTPDVAPGKFLLAPQTDGLTIIDNSGRVVWFRPTGYGGKGERVTNLRRQTLNGKPVLTYWKASSNARDTHRLTTFEILNNRYRRTARFTPGNGYKADLHELELTPRNTALIIAVRGVRWNASKQGGSTNTKVLDNIVQEIDLKSGAVLFEWHSLGNVSLSASATPIPVDGRPYDYFHANSIADDGNAVLVSGRRPSTIYRIDRDTAQVRWRLRGDGTRPRTNDFLMGEGISFGYQHDARRLEDGSISIFDNGSQKGDEDQPGLPTVNAESSAMVVRLGREGSSRTATLVERASHPDRLVSDSQASAEKQGNGNFVVGWGSLPQVTEFNEQGEIVFDATFDESEISSYRAYKAPWQGFPTDRPAVSSRRDAEGTTVWASWNGATRVRGWKVLTGSSRNNLVEAGSSAWDGLETEISIPEADALIQVAAIDSAGKEIRRSRLIELGRKSHPVATSAQGRAALEKRLLRDPFLPLG